MHDFVVMIPARYGSTRLAGKVLRELAGYPLIHHVIARGCESGAERVVVATDDRRVARACEGWAETVVTAGHHDSGTDRLAEAVGTLGLTDETVVINLQGDEPLMAATLLRATAQDLAAHPDAPMATVAVPMEPAERDNPNAVKVVTDRDGYALYFSRALIPYPRDQGGDPPEWRRHLGLYAYRAGFLRRYPALEPAPMERAERLEQLRALWHGYRIHVLDVAQAPPAGVDTEADLRRLEALLAKG